MVIWLVNIVIPGAGLILLRREWLGFCLAVIFALCANVTVSGFLIAPRAWPTWFTCLGACLSAASWALAQVLCRNQLRAIGRYSDSVSGMSSPDNDSGLTANSDADSIQ